MNIREIIKLEDFLSLDVKDQPGEIVNLLIYCLSLEGVAVLQAATSGASNQAYPNIFCFYFRSPTLEETTVIYLPLITQTLAHEEQNRVL